ncbi:MAG TPA: transglycosylase SLT domain-containing protein, partial [Gemmatimonadaceae bacterium]|nr:transglycosylase SLT domain-containing protein [Gemmatimonadaceae bacterium]
MDTPESDVRQETEDLAFPNDRRRSAGNVYTNVRRRADERKPRKRWQKVLLAAAHGVGASALLAAGVFWTLNHQQGKYVKPGDLLKLPASLVVAPPPLTEQVFRVSSVLRKYTKDTVRANTIANAIIREGGKRNLDPALLVGLLLTENAKLDPQARSNVSARGLMQVMP